jgi:phospholipid-transporting ATPase
LLTNIYKIDKKIINNFIPIDYKDTRHDQENDFFTLSKGNISYKNSFFFFKKRMNWQEMSDREILTNNPDLSLCNNAISTSKYSWMTFLPKNLLEQFTKMANVYFLVK